MNLSEALNSLKKEVSKIGLKMDKGDNHEKLQEIQDLMDFQTDDV